MDSAEEYYAADRAAWRAWLLGHHNTKNAVWLIFDKGQARTMSWQDIVEEALCVGWIDSRPGKVSATRSKIYVSRRKPRSVWSKRNKQLVAELIADGRMQPAGLAAVEAAKNNGSWSALDLSDNLIYPDELIAGFEKYPSARIAFERFPEGSRRNTLQWIYDAKTQGTRNKRIAQVIDAALSNQRIR